MIKLSIKKILVVIISLLLLWYLLFDLLFPSSTFLPSVSIIFHSYSDLLQDYNFLFQLLSTISSIYFGMIAGFFLIRFKFPLINSNNKFLRKLQEVISYLHFLPEIIIAILLVTFFGNTLISKYLFSFLVSALLAFKTVQVSGNNFEGSINSARSFGISESIIKRKILWKLLEPEIADNFISNHIYLWTLVLSFEIIQSSNGLGFLLINSLRFNDHSLIIALALLIFILILFIHFGLQKLKIKIYYWI